MIISRSPLRISILGGGCDLHSYYSKFGCTFVSAAIDQYVYTTIHKTYHDYALLRYSKIEKIDNFDKIEHPIIREAIKLVGINDINIEITSMADQASGTGLGSSGSFTTALLKALHKYNKVQISPQQLAELACYIEIDLLKEPIGKQDQYIAAFGGISVFKIDTDGNVNVSPLKIKENDLNSLEENLVMFSTGVYRAASSVLSEQNNKSLDNNQEMINNLHYVQEMCFRGMEHLERGNLTDYGLLMREHWEHKKKRSNKMSNPNIDRWIDIGLNKGAISGKLIGAGSGGFILFYTEEKSKLCKAMREEGLRELDVRFDYEGTKIL